MIGLIYFHLISAFLSLGLLIIRGTMQLNQQNWRNIKLLKILPHISDSLLMLSGILLLALFGFGVPVWLIAKILLLVLYIFAAAKFFSRKANQPNKAYFLLALASFVGAMLLGFFH